MLTFFKIKFFKNIFQIRNTIRVSNGLDLDQGLCFVGPDLGSNCLQSFSTDMRKVAARLPHLLKLYIFLSKPLYKL